jgi:hypothetical protein
MQIQGNDNAGDFVSTAYAARKLRRARSTIRRMCERGKIVGARQLAEGGKWDVPASWLHSMLEAIRPRRREA